jgi:hypothetical protein
VSPHDQARLQLNDWCLLGITTLTSSYVAPGRQDRADMPNAVALQRNYGQARLRIVGLVRNGEIFEIRKV